MLSIVSLTRCHTQAQLFATNDEAVSCTTAAIWKMLRSSNKLTQHSAMRVISTILSLDTDGKDSDTHFTDSWTRSLLPTLLAMLQLDDYKLQYAAAELTGKMVCSTDSVNACLTLFDIARKR
jgi:hypothetical protein